MYVIVNGVCRVVKKSSRGYYYVRKGKRVYTKAKIHGGKKPGVTGRSNAPCHGAKKVKKVKRASKKSSRKPKKAGGKKKKLSKSMRAKRAKVIRKIRSIRKNIRLDSRGESLASLRQLARTLAITTNSDVMKRGKAASRGMKTERRLIKQALNLLRDKDRYDRASALAEA